MASILVVHGNYGHSQENWFPWLSKQLTALGHTLVVPDFPTPKNQSLQTWQTVFDAVAASFDEQSIFIGHSLGVTFLLRVLEKLSHPIQAAFFVSGLYTYMGIPEFDATVSTFVDPPYDWDRVRSQVSHIELFHADNDPYVKLEQAEFIATKLKAPLTVVPGAGHLNEAAGYKEFPQLLTAVQQYL